MRCITTDIEATQARTRLDKECVRLLDEDTPLAATQRRLESAHRERDAAYGLTPTATEPSWVAKVCARGTTLGRALGVVPPVYDMLVKNMRTTEVAGEGLEFLQGEELQQQQHRIVSFSPLQMHNISASTPS